MRLGARPRKPRKRRDIKLWLSLTPFLLLLTPLIFLVMGIAVFLPLPFGVNPAMALSGAQIDIDQEPTKVRFDCE